MSGGTRSQSRMRTANRLPSICTTIASRQNSLSLVCLMRYSILARSGPMCWRASCRASRTAARTPTALLATLLAAQRAHVGDRLQSSLRLSSGLAASKQCTKARWISSSWFSSYRCPHNSFCLLLALIAIAGTYARSRLLLDNRCSAHIAADHLQAAGA